MRDIFYKNLTSLDHLQRDILLSEAFVEHGVVTKTEKHFIYFVRDHAFLNSSEELGSWVKKYADKGPHLKNLAVLKCYDSKLGEESFEVKIEGNLYILQDQEIFNIDFMQIFKVGRKGEALKEVK